MQTLNSGLIIQGFVHPPSKLSECGSCIYFIQLKNVLKNVLQSLKQLEIHVPADVSCLLYFIISQTAVLLCCNTTS